MLSGSAFMVLLVAGPLLAIEPGRWDAWSQELLETIKDPWFAFGMAAQSLFFLRFIVQWVVSERRRKSTIPVAFWYLSLAGGLSTFVYALHEAQPVWMLGQLLACAIYVRNLMLIHGRPGRLRRAGLPSQTPESAPNENRIIEE